MKQTYKTKYDPDVISLLIILLDYLVENNYSGSEIYSLSKHLQNDTQTTLKLLRLEGSVSRLSEEVKRADQLASQVSDLLSQLEKLVR